MLSMWRSNFKMTTLISNLNFIHDKYLTYVLRVFIDTVSMQLFLNRKNGFPKKVLVDVDSALSIVTVLEHY